MSILIGNGRNDSLLYIIQYVSQTRLLMINISIKKE